MRNQFWYWKRSGVIDSDKNLDFKFQHLYGLFDQLLFSHNFISPALSNWANSFYSINVEDVEPKVCVQEVLVWILIFLEANI